MCITSLRWLTTSGRTIKRPLAKLRTLPTNEWHIWQARWSSRVRSQVKRAMTLRYLLPTSESLCTVAQAAVEQVPLLRRSCSLSTCLISQRRSTQGQTHKKQASSKRTGKSQTSSTPSLNINRVIQGRTSLQRRQTCDLLRMAGLASASSP